MTKQVNGDLDLRELELMLRDFNEKLKTKYPYRNGMSNEHVRKVIDQCNEITLDFGHLLVTTTSNKVA